MAQFTPDERSIAGRLPKRTRYDVDVVHKLVNQVPILHVSFSAPLKDAAPFPTILPMLGAIGTYKGTATDDDNNETGEEASLYLHGSSVARLSKLVADNGEVALCVCATMLDGYVLALAPFHNSCNYRSAIVYGYASLVQDAGEIEYALRLITNNSIPHRWENSRSPATRAELTATAVLRVRIETASAKTRAGGPSDDKADLQNSAVADNTWTGVVPAYTTLSTPIPSEYNRVKLPEYLDDWVLDVNSGNEQYAVDAVDG